MNRPRLALLIGTGLVLAVAAIILNRPGGDPLPDMIDMPYAFITCRAAGYDAAGVTIVRGSSTPPHSVQVGEETAWPAYWVDDPALVPLQDGRPYIFPLIEDRLGQHSPPLPPSGRILSGAALRVTRPYITPEGAAMLRAFRERHRR